MICYTKPNMAVLLIAYILITIPGVLNAQTMGPLLPDTFDQTDAASPDESPYWNQFNDPILSELIKRGLDDNFDVQGAKHRIAQAEAIARQALAPLLPSVSAEGSYRLSPYGALGSGVEIPTMGGTGDGPNVIHSLSAVVNANYLIDITGKHYTARQGALKEAAASKADADTQASHLATLIVQTYYDAVTAQIRLNVVEKQIENNEGLLNLVEARFKTGAANALDVLQQRQQLESTKAQLPLVRALIATSKQQLVVLIGETTADALPEIPSQLPELRDEPPVGTPERLLKAKPEIRAAQKRLEASEEKEKSAFLTLLPSLALNGQVGYGANYGDQLDHGEIWSLGVLLSIPLYQGGANHAALSQARAATQTASSALHSAVLQAKQNVDSTLVREREQRNHLDSLVAQYTAAEQTLGEAQKRYIVGLSDYLNVLAAVSTVQNTELGLLQAKRDLVAARIQLLDALGGEWTKHLLAE